MNFNKTPDAGEAAKSSAPQSDTKRMDIARADITRTGARPIILHLCADLVGGEAARETIDLAILTQRQGWRAMVASAGGTLATEAERTGVRHIRMPLDKQSPLSVWRNRVQLESLVQRERPALIHVHGAEPLPIACRLARQHRIPLIADLIHPLPDSPKFKNLPGLLNGMHYTLRVPSAFMAAHVSERLGALASAIVEVPPGIDMQVYNASNVSPERLHNLSRFWRLPEQSVAVLVPMPLLPKLGHNVFLQAMAHMQDNAVYAVMVGNDRHAPGLRAEMEAQIGRLGLNGKVIMPEDCADWPAAFWLTSVAIAPNSAPRGQNIELLGAQAMGRPVIATQCGANAEMALAGETAWMVPPEDPVALATALREAVSLDTEQRLAIAANTRRFITQNFPRANWFNGMIEAYKNLITPYARTKPKETAAQVA